jgi:putative tricarboxylic transport membrane protein
MARKEWIINAAMFVIGVVFLVESLRLGLGSVRRPGPGLLPLYTGVALSLVSAFSLVRCFLAAKHGKGEEKFFGQAIINVVIILIGLVAYVFLLPWLGYLLSTFMLLMFLFRAGGFRKWGLISLSALVTTSVTYLVFSSWLNLRFPKGFLGF